MKHDFKELKEKTRDFIRAIAYAPTRVVDFFKSLFKEEEQEKQRQLEIAEKQRLENLYTPTEREILANITDYDKAYLETENEELERVYDWELDYYQDWVIDLLYKKLINNK